MKKTNLWLTLIVFLTLSFLYLFLLGPVVFINGKKIYNGLYTQADIITYLDYFKREIEGRSFFEWFTKLETTNLSLVYFSSIVGFAAKVQLHDLVLTSLMYCLIIYAVDYILKSFEVGSRYSTFSLLTFFSMIVYMQTISKEAVILVLFMISFVAVHKKNYFLLLISVFFLLSIRLYFALIVLVSIIFFKCFQIRGKIFFYFALTILIFITPFAYKMVFANFFNIQGIKYGVGINSYFIGSSSYPGALIVWAPFRVFQNLCEPVLALGSLQFKDYIFNISTLLDSLTAVAIFLMLFLILLNYRKITKSLQGFPMFLAIFIGVYLLVIGFLPIIHFRYLSLILPILGMFLDLTWKEKNEA